MTRIRLTNTRTRRKEDFTPIDPTDVRLYLCGPTVYDRAHLGNARPVLVFDVLVRLLRYVYGDDAVTYVRNFTDVDDKINAEAQRRKEAGSPLPLEALIAERTEETIAWYHADMDALGALRPDQEPRATSYIPQMVAMIETLIAGGHAYAAEGHVLFDVRSYPDYGKLSGRSVDDMIAGARVEVAPFKRDPMDFVLWKPSSDDLPGWDSPWGRGRPGWHIECSAMSAELLGDSFDIHGGGIDLQFPHHENEIAQSCCAHPQASFANVWLHNEMLQVEGRKMSKSLGNFFTVRDLLDQGVPGEVIRFVFLMTHYRKPMDWTETKRQEAVTTLRKWHDVIDPLIAPSSPLSVRLNSFPYPEVVDALSNDLNTNAALKHLGKRFPQVHSLRNKYFHDEMQDIMALKAELARFVTSARLLGLFPEVKDLSLRDKIYRVTDIWNKKRLQKEYQAADALRDRLRAWGISLQASSTRDSSMSYGVGFSAVSELTETAKIELNSMLDAVLRENKDR